MRKNNMLVIKGVIDRFEEDWAVIATEDHQEILWPKNKLPEGLKEGSSVSLAISDSLVDQQEREALAKAMLNEILNTSTNDAD